MRLSLSSSRQSQHGAFSIMAAATLLMSLLFLVLVLDSGRLYLEQRHLQKIADTAALETIAKVTNGNCSSDDISVVQGYAKDNANRYGSSGETPLVQCVTVSSINGLRQAQLDSANGRAVKVTTAKTVPASLVIKAQSLVGNIPSTIRLQATAVAERGEPTASFTVGSQLLRLENSKLLGQLLKAVGVNPERLTVLDADGLANATITPAGLLKALGVNLGIHELKALTPQGLIDLVDTKVGLLGIDEILKVSAEVVSDPVLGLELGALEQDILSAPLLKDIKINLLGDEDRAGLLNLTSNTEGPLGSALDARINLGSIISTALLIGVHETGQAAEMDFHALGQTIQLGIVEPPSIGVGPVGTKAYNAQIRLYIDVDTNKIPLIGAISGWLIGTRVHLPIWIDVVSAHGTLEKISCNVQPATVDIKVESSILNACVGKIPEDLKWSTSASCESNLQDEDLIKVLDLPLGGELLSLLNIKNQIHVPALIHSENLNIDSGGTKSTLPNPIRLGNTVEKIITELTNLIKYDVNNKGILNQLLNLLSNLLNPSTTDSLLKDLLKILEPILNAIGDLLNLILADVLGIELGRTDVTVSSINCNNPVLVR